MRQSGANRIYAKKLSPNDNSRNQIYLGGDFSALNIIPHGLVHTDSRETAGSIRDRAKASVDFYWIDGEGRHRAPSAGLILYPKYPEVRMSGFLLGCRAAPSEIMRVRDEGRIMFFGITPEGSVLGFASAPDNPISAEFSARDWQTAGVFAEIPLNLSQRSSKSILLDELKRIYHLHWIASQRLGAGGTRVPYSAPNAGGYTLEAELGISPNGYSEPDFMGWEIKQFGVNNFQTYRPKSPVTLLTPEPTGGIYRTEGVAAFLHRFGYAAQNGQIDRLNFGGRYDCQRGHHSLTGLRMTLVGFDAASGKITDLDGGLSLISTDEEVAASWSFKGLMAHWNRKHAQAAYVPSLHRRPPPEYCFGAKILLCEKTDFLLFLKAFSAGAVYYDPGVKMEQASSGKPVIKRRSQFRVAHADLPRLYRSHETTLLT
jgi:hypothetical protein